MKCPESGYQYQEVEPGLVRCMDLTEEAPLPGSLRKGSQGYREFKDRGKE